MRTLGASVLALLLGACSDPVDPFVAYRDARYEEARAGFEHLAGEGDLNAVNALGVIHLLGLTGPRDPERAADLFFKAAVGGVADAQRNVGGLYERGETVRKNLPLAYGWYDIASRNGHEVARVHAESIGAQLSANMAKQGRERVAEVLRGVREPER
jgi:TPR repeat protein